MQSQIRIENLYNLMPKILYGCHRKYTHSLRVYTPTDNELLCDRTFTLKVHHTTCRISIKKGLDNTHSKVGLTRGTLSR